MLSQEQSLSIFRRMLLSRRFEETVIDLWATVETEGYRHVYIGQEAVGAVVMELLGEDDLILTTHRNHGHIVMRGADPGRALAEVLGRRDGFNGGRGGSSGMTVRELGFLATTGVVGGGVGLGTGAALAQKVRAAGGISATFFGDGGLEEGIAFESMNMAALFKLPVLFICENNSVGVTAGRAQNEWSSSSMAAETLGDIPRSLNIVTEVVDGADADGIFLAVSKFIDQLRSERNPAFVEMRTHRWPGSRTMDPKLLTGVTDLNAIWEPESISGEHAAWIDGFDPIVLFGRTLIAREQANHDTLTAIDVEIQSQLTVAREFALASPLPSPDSGLTGTFA